MSRVKRGVAKKARHKKILKMAKGYRGRAKNCFRVAIQKLRKHYVMLIVIVKLEKETSVDCGFSVSTLQFVNMDWFTQDSSAA